MEDKMRRSIVLLGIVGMLVLVLAVPAFAARTTGRGTGPTVHVLEQNLVYDSIVTADPLPWNGQDNWQLLTPGGANGALLTTQFGPGDVGYRGGRWYMEGTAGIPGPSADDHFFLCPLLGPGRDEA
jgi:hypothetical protein